MTASSCSSKKTNGYIINLSLYGSLILMFWIAQCSVFWQLTELQWYNSNDQHLDSKWMILNIRRNIRWSVRLLPFKHQRNILSKTAAQPVIKVFKVNKEFLMHRFGAYFFWRGVCIICCISWILEKSKKFDGRHQRSHFTWAEWKPQTAFI